jgi:stage IV sporulation protein FA
MHIFNKGEYMKKTIKKKLVLKKEIKVFLNKLLISIIIFLTALISVKKTPTLKPVLKDKIYEDSFKFITIKNFYEKYFGDFLSNKVSKETTSVFNEKLSYQKINKYKDGVELIVNTNYLVPVIESGIVVYIGEKEDYGYTVIVEQVNGIDVFYSNINPIDIKIYDYVEKGSLLGETKNNNLYLVFQKNGAYLDYKKYI